MTDPGWRNFDTNLNYFYAYNFISQFISYVFRLSHVSIKNQKAVFSPQIASKNLNKIFLIFEKVYIVCDFS